jgi:diguanylate cyclase (GGDEF)-like protein/PAS domain S-box-containing protein
MGDWYNADAAGYRDAETAAGSLRPDPSSRPPLARDRRQEPASLVDAMADAAIVVAADGRIVAANRIADRLFGAVCQGRQLEELVPAPLRAAHAGLRAGFVADRASRPMGVRPEVLAARADGSTFPVEVSLSSIEIDLGPAVLAIVVDVSARAARTFQLEHLAMTDPLTGLANREALRAALASRFSVRASRRPVVALAIDLDGLREANRRLGHAGGDAVLRRFAHRLQATVRAGDFVARTGGDEFLVLCDGSLDGAMAVASRLTGSRIERRAGENEPLAIVTASVGIAVRRSREGSATFLRRADEALLAAKRAGGDQIVVAPA